MSTKEFNKIYGDYDPWFSKEKVEVATNEELKEFLSLPMMEYKKPNVKELLKKINNPKTIEELKYKEEMERLWGDYIEIYPKKDTKELLSKMNNKKSLGI